MKISIIGAGNVGATTAMRLIENDIGDVILFDIVSGLPQGKAIDISDSASVIGFKHNIIGTNDYKDIKNSDVIVVTAGFPRQPGMTREELITKNASIVRSVVEKVKESSKNAILVVVTNPLDIMCYYAYKISGFPKSKIIGMAGALDTARFKNLISKEANVPTSEIEACIIGSHDDNMVPLVSKTLIKKKKITDVMEKERLENLIERTKNRGAEIVSYLKSGSAYYSPSAGVLEILKAIKDDSGKVISASAYLEGEYGVKGFFIGVPCKIGKSGIEKIVELDLSEEEKEAFKASCEKVKKACSLTI